MEKEAGVPTAITEAPHPQSGRGVEEPGETEEVIFDIDGGWSTEALKELGLEGADLTSLGEASADDFPGGGDGEPLDLEGEGCPAPRSADLPGRSRPPRIRVRRNAPRSPDPPGSALPPDRRPA